MPNTRSTSTAQHAQTTLPDTWEHDSGGSVCCFSWKESLTKSWYCSEYLGGCKRSGPLKTAILSPRIHDKHLASPRPSELRPPLPRPVRAKGQCWRSVCCLRREGIDVCSHAPVTRVQHHPSRAPLTPGGSSRGRITSWDSLPSALMWSLPKWISAPHSVSLGCCNGRELQFDVVFEFAGSRAAPVQCVGRGYRSPTRRLRGGLCRPLLWCFESFRKNKKRNLAGQDSQVSYVICFLRLTRCYPLSLTTAHFAMQNTRPCWYEHNENKACV